MEETLESPLTYSAPKGVGRMTRCELQDYIYKNSDVLQKMCFCNPDYPIHFQGYHYLEGPCVFSGATGCWEGEEVPLFYESVCEYDQQARLEGCPLAKSGRCKEAQSLEWAQFAYNPYVSNEQLRFVARALEWFEYNNTEEREGE